MTRISMIIVALCGLLASPVLSYWEYDGTNSWPSGPSSDSDPYGTWAWWQIASGLVSGGPGYLDAWASAAGGAEVHLEPWPGYGLSRSVYATSGASGSSYYHWVDDATSREISFTVEVTIDGAGVEYWGNALDRTATCAAACASGAYGMVGSSVAYLGSFNPYGEGHGVANSQGGTYADNDWEYVDVEPDDDYSDYYQGFLHGYYEGSLRFTCDAYLYYDWDEPYGNNLTVSSAVQGFCFAQGQLVISNPEFYWGGFDAEAGYGITACSQLRLYGNIDDRL